MSNLAKGISYLVPALEGLVSQHSRAWVAYRNKGEELYFWRTREGSEVDFVIYGDEGLRAIEVKRPSSIDRNDLRHLKTFMENYPQSEGFFLYGGQEQRLVDEVLCLPVEKFLRQLKPSNDSPYAHTV